MTTKKELLRLIRLNCSECIGGARASERISPVRNPGDIEGCTCEDCAFYPFRFGADPKPNRKRSVMGRNLGRTLKPRV